MHATHGQHSLVGMSGGRWSRVQALSLLFSIIIIIIMSYYCFGHFFALMQHFVIHHSYQGTVTRFRSGSFASVPLALSVFLRPYHPLSTRAAPLSTFIAHFRLPSSYLFLGRDSKIPPLAFLPIFLHILRENPHRLRGGVNPYLLRRYPSFYFLLGSYSSIRKFCPRRPIFFCLPLLFPLFALLWAMV